MPFTIPSDASAGDPVQATQWNQVLAALRYAAQGNAVGVLTPFFGASAPNGSLLCTGKTIGDGSSGGTARANADMETLFTHLWNETTNSELVIQDSSGSNTTRGANAAADFAAHKRMPLPDLRGRFPLGKDNMGGTSANRVTDTEADTIGASSGNESAAHTHSVNGAGSDVARGNYAGMYSTTTSSATVNKLSPYITTNYIIWAGVYW